MSKIEEVEPGFDFYLHCKGIRMLDEPLYFILRSLKEGILGRDFLEAGGATLLSRKMRLLSEFLGEPVELDTHVISKNMLELMERFELEKKGMDNYLRHGRPPVLTVDGAVFMDGKLVLIRRKNEPFKGMHALPGGFVDYGESTEDAVVREVREETGLETQVNGLVGVYSDPERDPRGHTVSAIYLLEVIGGELKEGDDAEAVGLFDPGELPPLAFDHSLVVKDILRTDAEYS